MPNRTLARSGDRSLLAASCALLTLCFVTGGSSQQSGIGVSIAEFASIFVALYALRHAALNGRLVPVQWSMAAMLSIALVPLLQMVPLPAGLWNLPPDRLPLQHDLAAAGVTAVRMRWSLAPAATERAVLSLLPGIALFFAAIAMGRAAWRVLLWWVIGLSVFSVLLAFAQLGVPQDSAINPFPQYEPALAGVFANKNHEADALAIGLVLSGALLLDARRRARQSSRPHQVALVSFALLTLFFALLLPLVNSRAGVIIAMLAAAAVVSTSGAISMERLRARRSTRIALVAALVVFSLGAYAALAWMHSDAALADSRWALSHQTLQIGLANGPLGSGLGSFVPTFQQATGTSMLVRTYINAAHDDYAQVWLEGGVLAVAAMLAGVATLIVSLIGLVRRPADSGTRAIGLAAWMGLLVLLMHSTVDYPLRTPALMAVFALLAGIAIAAAGRGPLSEA